MPASSCFEIIGVGQPADFAGAFVLLASDEASYISGAVIPVTERGR